MSRGKARRKCVRHGHSAVESGYGSTTLSTVLTEYAPCACNPLGKMLRRSAPYAPGETVRWTTYSYDCTGRTVTVKSPDNDTTSYVYQGFTTTVTDPKGKWKKFTNDQFGNLVTVEEPGGLFTYYTYTVLDKLATVSMTRNGVTQNRTFTYDGPRLISATNPENGTVTYTYNAAGQMDRRTDAKGQVKIHHYDVYGRLWSVAVPNGPYQETTEISYYYDSNPFDANGRNGRGGNWRRCSSTGRRRATSTRTTLRAGRSGSG